ncbi:MAG: lytic murein transglycosylase [Mesorhizobium sp.]|nr:MAG: lytic murein transglycosylase [Mesorhizobium sp.]
MTLRSYTPLCPAGHLPRKGGDRISHRLSPIFSVAERAARSKLPISPLAGEMAGRPEGGVTERCLRDPVTGTA